MSAYVHTFRLATQREIHPDWIWRVDIAVDVAAQRLRLPPIEVVWVVPDASGSLRPEFGRQPADRVLGWTTSGDWTRIYLVAGAPDLLHTALHEARHLHQMRHPGYTDVTERETDADAWAAETMTRPFHYQGVTR